MQMVCYIDRFPQCIWTTGRLVCLAVKKKHMKQKSSSCVFS